MSDTSSRFSLRAWRTVRAASTLATLTMGVAPLAAQPAADQPAAFVHGFMSGELGWVRAGDSLASVFRIRPSYPELTWNNRWADQAGELDNAMAGEGQIIAVGHSNGGLITRVWSRGGGPTDRIATVGSLHQGAQLAERAITGAVFNYPDLVLGDILAAFEWYSYWESQRTGLAALGALAMVFDVSNGVYTLMRRIRDILADWGFFEIAAYVGVPALYDMSPARSEYFTNANGFGLNTPANLAREALATRARVGIIGRYGVPGSIMLNTLRAGRAQSWINARYILHALSVTLWDYYENYLPESEPYYAQLHGGSVLWFTIAFDMEVMDVYWLYNIGALGDYDPVQYVYNWEESDGIVPESSQQYPGRTNERVVEERVTHTEEKQSPAVLRQLELTFEADFQVPRRAQTVASVQVSPSTLSLTAGQTAQLGATARNAAGGTITGRQFNWLSSDTTVATVTSAAGVTARAVGTASITATVDGVVGSASVQVSAPAPAFTAVSIAGPVTIRAGATCLWVASTSGGSGFSYQWTRNGSIVGTNASDVTLTESGGGTFTLAVSATDNTGVTRSTSRQVSVSSSAGVCLQ